MIQIFSIPVGYESGAHSTFSYTVDDPMTSEINADPDETAALHRSSAQYEEGDTDCLADGESVADDIDSDD